MISEATGQQVSANPLGEALGIDAAGIDLLGDVFAEASASMGLDGRAIFERLRAGQTMGQALALPNGLRDLLYARAHQWFTIGRHDKAEGLFRTLCILDGSVADYWMGLGICLRLKSQWQQAHDAFQSASALRPDWAIPYFHALEAFIRQGDWASAGQAMQAYDARSQKGVPDTVRKEMVRFRTAIEFRQKSSDAGGGPA